MTVKNKFIGYGQSHAHLVTLQTHLARKHDSVGFRNGKMKSSLSKKWLCYRECTFVTIITIYRQLILQLLIRFYSPWLSLRSQKKSDQEYLNELLSFSIYRKRNKNGLCGEDDGDYVRLREIPGVGAVVAIPKGDPSDDTASEDNKVIEIPRKN